MIKFRREHICPYVSQYASPNSGCMVSGVVCYEDEYTEAGCMTCAFNPQESERRLRGKLVEFDDSRYPGDRRYTLRFRALRK